MLFRSIAARFRMSSDSVAVSSPIGDAPDGEVEDWMITVSANPYTNPKNRYDVTGDGFVSPIDVLQIVNYINAGFPSRPPLPPVAVPPYLDVNGDGFINALDVLAVIGQINSGLAGRGGEGEGGDASSGDVWVPAPSYDRPTAQSLNANTRSSTGAAPVTSTALRANDTYLASFFSNEADREDVVDLTVQGITRDGATKSRLSKSTLDEALSGLFE